MVQKMIYHLNNNVHFILSHPWLWWLLVVSTMVLLLFLGLRFCVWRSLLAQQEPESLKVTGTSKGGWKGIINAQTFLALVALLGGSLGFVLWSWSGLIAGMLAGALLPKAFNYRQQQQQQKDLSQQLPLFLRALGSTLKAGYSVPQALKFVALEVQSPLREHLAPGVQSLALQQPLELVLTDWQRSIKQPEWHFLTDSLVLQSKSGGNLVDLCHKVAFLLEERLKLERDLKSFTAQGKMSGYLMAGLWPTSLLLFAWLAPSHTDVLFNTRPGQFLLGLSLLLELVGFYFIWRLVRVKM